MDEDLKNLTLLSEAKDKLRLSMRKDLTKEENLKIAKENYDIFSKLYEDITGQKYEKSFEDLKNFSKE